MLLQTLTHLMISLKPGNFRRIDNRLRIHKMQNDLTGRANSFFINFISVKYGTMKRISFYILMIAISISACKKLSKYEGVPFTEKEPRDWENPEVFNINREDPHASLISFPDETALLML